METKERECAYNMKDSYYVSTSIPYVNGAPHIGHAMEFVLGDIMARYHKQYGSDVFFSTGSDEHGGKIMEKAAEQGLEPQQFVDQTSQYFVDLSAALSVEYTKFVRTTDPDHEARAAAIWKALGDNIYMSKYSGMYDQKEETFLTHEEARQIQKTDPARHKRLVEIEEENYFFKLAKYNTAIIDLIKSGKMVVYPKTRQNEMMSLLESGLKDISISRPTSKIPWGIPVPGDQTQTMYVWFEALMNYITTLGYPEGEQFAKFWPADVHIIGKDITRFHAVIWPAMLMGLGIETPRVIYVHGHIKDAGGDIMSKSMGNGIAPNDVISGYGADALRYYVARHVPGGEDNNFSWERFETIYNTELGNELGNLVQRTASMIKSYQGGVIGDLPESMHDIAPFHDYFEEFRFDQALDYVWTLIRGLNQYIEDEKPWQIAKNDEPEHLREVLAYIVASTLQIADLIQPITPNTTAGIIRIFGDGIVPAEIPQLFPRVNNHTEPHKQ